MWIIGALAVLLALAYLIAWVAGALALIAWLL